MTSARGKIPYSNTCGFDLETGMGRLVGMIDFLGLAGLILGLFLEIRESLPGTKKPRHGH